MRRGVRILCAGALVLLSAGCAVGHFITGAPSNPSARSTRNDSALLLSRCSGCHDVPDPEMMTAAEWHQSLERMKRRMRLPASEWDSLAAMASTR